MSPQSPQSFDWLAHHAYTRPDKLAVIDLGSDRRFTWAEVNDRTSRLANGLLREFGVGRGDRVAVLAHNSSNFFEVQFACWKLGAIMVPLNWRLAVPELEYIVGDAAPTVLIHDEPLADIAEQAAKLCSIDRRINWDGGSGAASTGSGLAADYEELILSVEPFDNPLLGFVDDPTGAGNRRENRHDDPVIIMYTSGTTGRPKGAIITQGMMFWNVVNCTEFFRLGADMVNLAFLPLFHTGGLNCFANPAFHYGGTNIIMRDFDPSAALELMTNPDHRVTHLLGVPANFLFMSQDPAFETASFPTNQICGVGGSPTPEPLIRTWADKGLPLQQAFGMTETSPMVLSLGPEDAVTKIGAAGKPGMHTQVRIVDDNGDDVTKPGVTGELWVRGPNVTPGYWNKPEATAEAITDGWLHTGDAARTDDDGYYYIIDRWKDMYISGGENVYPAEVESVLYELPEVAEVSVIGVPDEKWVEVGRACVVLKEGASLDAATIINHCRAKLARFKVPQSVVFLDEIPHNATGKVLKRELRRLHGDADRP